MQMREEVDGLGKYLVPADEPQSCHRCGYYQDSAHCLNAHRQHESPRWTQETAALAWAAGHVEARSYLFSTQDQRDIALWLGHQLRIEATRLRYRLPDSDAGRREAASLQSSYQ